MLQIIETDTISMSPELREYFEARQVAWTDLSACFLDAPLPVRTRELAEITAQEEVKEIQDILNGRTSGLLPNFNEALSVLEKTGMSGFVLGYLTFGVGFQAMSDNVAVGAQMVAIGTAIMSISLHLGRGRSNLIHEGITTDQPDF